MSTEDRLKTEQRLSWSLQRHVDELHGDLAAQKGANDRLQRRLDDVQRELAAAQTAAERLLLLEERAQATADEYAHEQIRQAREIMQAELDEHRQKAAERYRRHKQKCRSRIRALEEAVSLVNPRRRKTVRSRT